MNTSNTYLFLSAFFIAVYLIIEFTDIFGNSAWFKAFILILSGTYLIMGIIRKRKK